MCNFTVGHEVGARHPGPVGDSCLGLSGKPEAPADPLAPEGGGDQDAAMPSTLPVAPILLAGAAPERAAELLREAGYRVAWAGTPAALWRLAAGQPAPSLILLDETVADEPGLSLVTRLQDDPATRRIHILYFAGGGDEELALALGASDCLDMPLRPLVLLARVRAQLRLAALDATMAEVSA